MLFNLKGRHIYAGEKNPATAKIAVNSIRLILETCLSLLPFLGQLCLSSSQFSPTTSFRRRIKEQEVKCSN